MIRVVNLNPLSYEEMLAHPNREYNPSEWVRSVNRYHKYFECQFYIIKDESVPYVRFAVKYVANEIRFMKEFSGYSSMLTSRPFAEVEMIQNSAVIKPFVLPNGTGYLENNDRVVSYLKIRSKNDSKFICSNSL